MPQPKLNAKLEIADIPIAEIGFDPDNPNEMTDAEFAALREEIKLRGFVQPVLVRKVPVDSANPAIRYITVDGEHRVKILRELGAETAPCVIETGSEVDAKIRLITMNRLRGSFVPLKLAELLANLSERLPVSEIRSRLAIDDAELQNLLDLVGYLDEQAPPPEQPEPVDKDDGVELAFVATPAQAEQIRKLLTVATKDDPEREAAVIARKAREFSR